MYYILFILSRLQGSGLGGLSFYLFLILRSLNRYHLIILALGFCLPTQNVSRSEKIIVTKAIL